MLEETKDLLNNLSNHIKFTIEIENNNQLCFLDILLTRQEGSLGFEVYRKKTHTERYLHANSRHHPKLKIGIIRTLKTRATKISDLDNLEDELNHLHKVFELNGYNRNTINKSIHQSLSKDNKDIKGQNLTTPKVSLPYIKGTTNKITKIINKHNINVAFTPINTIK